MSERDRIKNLLSINGYQVTEAGHGYWRLTKADGTARIVSLRIKSSATLHRKTQSQEYGIDADDWVRLNKINESCPVAIMVFDKQTRTLSFGDLTALRPRSRVYDGLKGDATAFVKQADLKPVAQLP